MGGKSEVKGKGDRGWRKGKAGGKGESAEGDRKEGRGMDGISLPHGRLRTLAALILLDVGLKKCTADLRRKQHINLHIIAEVWHLGLYEII